MGPEAAQRLDPPKYSGEPKYDIPCAVGLMSGKNAPLEMALKWCGWGVGTYDLLGTPFDPPVDLLLPEVRAKAKEGCAVANVVIF